MSLTSLCLQAVVQPGLITEASAPTQALYISKNYLTTLGGIRQLQGLKKLSAADNCLADFASLDGLQVHAQSLVAANFEGNPVAMLPNYRAQVRHRTAYGMAWQQ